MTSTAHSRPSLDDRIKVASDDPAWPAQAAQEIERLRTALGSRVREVEHIGSTSVAGMVAKPMAMILVLGTLGEDPGEARVPGRSTGPESE